MIKLISSGSHGNAILYWDSILVDCGVPFSHIQPYYKDIQIVLLTHIHVDHFNTATIKRLANLRPTVRFAIAKHMVEYMPAVSNVDVLEIGKIYNYGAFQISPVKLYHDVPNVGWRIFKDGKKLIHLTDTFTVEGITAKGYDYFCIETNYSEDKIIKVINEKRARGEFAHEAGAINSHLSRQQALEFYFKNKAEHSEFIPLHESKTSL